MHRKRMCYRDVYQVSFSDALYAVPLKMTQKHLLVPNSVAGDVRTLISSSFALVASVFLEPIEGTSYDQRSPK